MNSTSDLKYQKARETRQRILDAALTFFMRDGYEKTTMRKIARAASLTPGATYYYFPSKEHIIHYFYEKSFEDQMPISKAILESEPALNRRIVGTVKAHIDIARPYHEISKILFKTASNPDHSLSPFSEESKPLRDKNIAIFQEVINGTETPVPEILWLYKVAIIIHWVYDRSPRQQKTDALIERTADLLVKLIKISSLPVVKPFTQQLLVLMHEFKPYS